MIRSGFKIAVTFREERGRNMESGRDRKGASTLQYFVKKYAMFCLWKAYKKWKR